jgi:hypothetical protein
MTLSANCAQFREQVDELVLGGLDTPTRTHLFNHAATCPACQAALEQVALVADRLLLTVPEIEPPAGFENRVLERLTPASPPARSHNVRWRPVAAVAAVAMVLSGAILALVYSRDRAHEEPYAQPAATPAATAVTHAVRRGTIVRADGSVVGTASLLDHPRPLVLITIDRPRQSNNVVTCELVTADDVATSVGTWSYEEVASGAWAVGIDKSLLFAVRMNVRDPGGAILASAPLA